MLNKDNGSSVAMSSGSRLFSRRWIRVALLAAALLVLVCLWARWRPAQRFDDQELAAEEFRLVTWNVGYFAPVANKNARDVDLARIAEVLRTVSADVAILQELGSLEQADTLARLLDNGWHSHSVATGHGEQVLAVLTRWPGRVVSSPEAGGRKLLGIALRDDRNRRVFIVAVHSPHPARGMPDTIANIQGAVEMLEGRDEPVRIIAGDMNYNIDPDGNGFGNASLYDEITDVVADSTVEIGETYYGHTRIDHVFHFPKGLEVVGEASGMVDQSPRLANVPGFRDHRPIVVTYDISGAF